MRKNNRIKVCDFCGGKYETYKANRKFCSLSCAAKHKHKQHPQNGDKNPNYKGSLAISKYQHKKRWRLNNPQKAFAHDIVAAYIRAGKITRNPCEICGSIKTDAHHDDYNKPTEVRWLCRKHHRELHARLTL